MRICYRFDVRTDRHNPMSTCVCWRRFPCARRIIARFHSFLNHFDHPEIIFLGRYLCWWGYYTGKIPPIDDAYMYLVFLLFVLIYDIALLYVKRIRLRSDQLNCFYCNKSGTLISLAKTLRWNDVVDGHLCTAITANIFIQVVWLIRVHQNWVEIHILWA